MSGHDQPSARLRLAAELAVGLARRLWMTLEPSSFDGFYWHYAQTTFEEACDVLWELGVALAAVESGDQGMTRQQYVVDANQHPAEKSFPGAFKLFPAPETRAGVLAYGELPDALFGRLLAAYVETACQYGPNGTQLDSGEEPFKPTAEFEREIDALVACGYAERHGDMVKWTDKIAPVMYGEHCCDEPRPQIKVSRDVLERVHILVQDRDPIAAMALVRKETGASFFEAKAFVDEIARNSHPMSPHRPRR
jgi:hypothetical protein